MHFDWQQIAAMSLVIVAFVAVGRRLGAQIRAFGTPRRRRPAATPSEPPLMQIQLRPPARLTRERNEES